MVTSIFTNKAEIPNDFVLSEALGELLGAWMNLREYVFENYPKATQE